MTMTCKPSNMTTLKIRNVASETCLGHGWGSAHKHHTRSWSKPWLRWVMWEKQTAFARNMVSHATNKYHNLLIICSQAVDFNGSSKKRVGLFSGISLKYRPTYYTCKMWSLQVPYFSSILYYYPLLEISWYSLCVSSCRTASKAQQECLSDVEHTDHLWNLQQSAVC